MLQENEEILNRFMIEGFKRKGQTQESSSESQVSEELSEAGDATALQEDPPEKEEIDYAEPAAPVKKLCRVKHKFLLKGKSSLPVKMPPTLVFWNRCETQVEGDRFIK